MTALINQSERFAAKTVLLSPVASDINGDQSLDFEVPSTFGDCLLENARISVSTFATIATNVHLLSVALSIVHTTPFDIADFVGLENWHVVAGTLAAPVTIQAVIEPWNRVLCRVGESFRVAFAEVDTNAVPTADLVVSFRVIRLRSP